KRFLMQSLMGETNGSRSWGEPPRPRCLPKTALHRWQTLTDEQLVTFPNICPDFVVELRSSSDTLKSLQDKMVEYMENGAKLGWLINPQQRQVEVYRPGLTAEILDNPVELSGEEVLPGFLLDLHRVWD
ncbi:Uma2 family endonuclease, partial [Moorena sp. SIO3H5]|uniref:Uma2 family endonuclease n=1 Tax=Moorena sp. SIO3H5 TaxID=2607834 RepID=UPI0025D03B1C